MTKVKGHVSKGTREQAVQASSPQLIPYYPA